jgi:hypothetical protein
MGAKPQVPHLCCRRNEERDQRRTYNNVRITSFWGDLFRPGAGELPNSVANPTLFSVEWTGHAVAVFEDDAGATHARSWGIDCGKNTNPAGLVNGYSATRTLPQEVRHFHGEYILPPSGR